jgi:hypothetical protein
MLFGQNDLRCMFLRKWKQFKRCFAIALYSVCYSIISPCSYWTSSTLDAIIQYWSQPNTTFYSEDCLTTSNVPGSITIFGKKINVDINEVSHGKLTNLEESNDHVLTIEPEPSLSNAAVSFWALHAKWSSPL